MKKEVKIDLSQLPEIEPPKDNALAFAEKRTPVLIEETDVEKLEREIKEKKKLLRQKEKAKKEEELKKQQEEAEKELSRKAQDEEKKQVEVIIPPSSDIQEAPLGTLISIPKYCPLCNKKLKKSWVKNYSGFLIQEFVCKKRKCTFNKQIVFKI